MAARSRIKANASAIVQPVSAATMPAAWFSLIRSASPPSAITTPGGQRNCALPAELPRRDRERDRDRHDDPRHDQQDDRVDGELAALVLGRMAGGADRLPQPPRRLAR